MQCTYDNSNVCDLYEYYGSRPCDICDYCRNSVYKTTISKPLNKPSSDDVDLNIDLTEFYNFDIECIKRKKISLTQISVTTRAAPTTKDESVWRLLWKFFFGWIKG